ncbi:ribosome biosynthesis protein LTO1 Ecym_1103 [Eremothecium cymbalariae DBVPG|uniref:Essential protein Yae1 N-terminal domain-containing protein n=1 Tax=Eremothecium cymbalariae (strain CBS 270.75 / DBVPG 7215 / KCTC 17166 / NRRL Y-17582) TaxID=931890 RepID=G8JME9_ERECY|nr:hypothetical protein Ecym_1103 [Eremothecium cymbalariae DBVPG\
MSKISISININYAHGHHHYQQESNLYQTEEVNMDLDSLLNLEDQFYQEGYEEARREKLSHDLLEGRQYGLQVGFQRFAPLGQIRGICGLLLSIIDDSNIKTRIEAIVILINQIPMDNMDSSVAQYEKLMPKIRNKFRLVLMAMQKHVKQQEMNFTKLTFDDIELLIRNITGDLRAEAIHSDVNSVSIQDKSESW